MRTYTIFAMIGFGVGVFLPSLADAQAAATTDVDRVQLAVVDSGGASCPRDAVLTAWAHTRGPITVRFVVHNSGGGKTGELEATAVAGAAGTYLATHRHTFKITADVDTSYRVEAVGTGQMSNWVPLKASCGPQPRTTTSATGSGAQAPARTASEDRARASLGQPTDGGGRPPAHASSAADPESSEGGGNTPKPNPSTANDGKQCGSAISVTRYAALSREAGKVTAQVTWMAAVVQKHPDSWKDWNNAKSRSLGCERAGVLWTCTASARPCEP